MVGKFLRRIVLYALVAAAGSGFAYWRLAAARLPAAAGGMRVSAATPSLTGTAMPASFEAFVKETDRQNFLDSGSATGLVSARLEWSHAALAWIPDEGFEERQQELARARRGLARREVPALVRELRSEDAIAREISSRELALRTGQTFGYAWDGTAAERERAAAAWERWWADDANRAQYGAKRVLDFADGALDALRKALGEPKSPAGGSTGGASGSPAPGAGSGTGASAGGDAVKRGGARY